MLKADKRALEIWYHHFYMWYTMNNARHTYADFLQLPHLLQTNRTYDPEIIETVWKEFLMINPAPPSEDESLLVMTHTSKIINCSIRIFNPFYKLKGKNRRTRILNFRTIKVQLTPKIYHETFHDNLFEFFQQITYMFGNLKNIFK